MALHDPRQPVRFEPASEAAKPEAERRAYLLKAPTHWDKITLNKALGARGARFVTDLQMCRALHDAVERCYGDHESDVRASTLAAIDELIAATESLGMLALRALDEKSEETDKEFTAALVKCAELQEAIRPVEDIVRENDPRYARLCGVRAVYGQILGLEATRIFLVGWENGPATDGVPVVFARDANGVRADLIELIPDGHLMAIGARVKELLQPSETQRKNSASLSDTGSGPAASTDSSTATATSPSTATPSDSRSSTSGPNSGSTPPIS